MVDTERCARSGLYAVIRRLINGNEEPYDEKPGILNENYRCCWSLLSLLYMSMSFAPDAFRPNEERHRAAVDWGWVVEQS